MFKDAPKPALLKDRINFQVMGTNQWRHVPRLGNMSNDTLKFYLNNKLSNVNFTSQYGSGNHGNMIHYSLTRNKPTSLGFLDQTVDFTDRTLTGENN
ncbi:MAG: hypothetical protein ACJA1Z_001898 [Patiriisocius sp.]